jgi:ABC-type Zn uptake system ZnuABC Zn-binding protein ZnuA
MRVIRSRKQLAATVVGMSPYRSVALVRSLAAASILVLLAACGGGGTETATAGSADDGRLRAATTVAPITSIVSNVGGDLVDVEGIVPGGTDSHTFEPRPSVAELLSTVDVVYLNGLRLEEPTKELAEANLADGAEIVELGDAVLPEEDWIYDFSFPEEDGMPNPHLWTDPSYALAYAEVVRDDLSERDPGNAEAFAENYDAFAELVEELDGAMREAFATIPDGNRKLLTYHDAYPYFAQNYDFEVIGAIQVSNFEDPTPREVAALIDQVRAADIPAIFGSEVFPSPVLEQIGREADVRYVDELRDDDLPGEPGEEIHSWAGLMAVNYATMTEALGGDPSALEELDVRNVAPDEASYPR